MSAGWRARAACRDEDPALFFAAEVETPRARQTREAHAKAICGTCAVLLQCLVFRLGSENQRDGGIWAGKDEDERARLRRNMLRSHRERRAA